MGFTNCQVLYDLMSQGTRISQFSLSIKANKMFYFIYTSVNLAVLQCPQNQNFSREGFIEPHVALVQISESQHSHCK